MYLQDKLINRSLVSEPMDEFIANVSHRAGEILLREYTKLFIQRGQFRILRTLQVQIDETTQTLSFDRIFYTLEHFNRHDVGSNWTSWLAVHTKWSKLHKFLRARQRERELPVLLEDIPLETRG